MKKIEIYQVTTQGEKLFEVYESDKDSWFALEEEAFKSVIEKFKSRFNDILFHKEMAGYFKLFCRERNIAYTAYDEILNFRYELC